MKENTTTKIDLNQYSVYGQLIKEPKLYVKQEPYVGKDGIYTPVTEYVPEGTASVYKCVMTKEMFVEAYKKYINKPKRMYPGGWKR